MKTTTRTFILATFAACIAAIAGAQTPTVAEAESFIQNALAARYEHVDVRDCSCQISGARDDNEITTLSFAFSRIDPLRTGWTRSKEAPPKLLLATIHEVPAMRVRFRGREDTTDAFLVALDTADDDAGQSLARALRYYARLCGNSAATAPLESAVESMELAFRSMLPDAVPYADTMAEVKLTRATARDCWMAVEWTSVHDGRESSRELRKVTADLATLPDLQFRVSNIGNLELNFSSSSETAFTRTSRFGQWAGSKKKYPFAEVPARDERAAREAADVLGHIHDLCRSGGKLF